jgi:F-type H+-transporting ATPase subunit gamma
MTLRREVESRIALFEELSGIMGAMRSFALAELHRVMRREAAQHELLDSLEAIQAEMSRFLPPPARSKTDIWLLFGSSRGFCGSFNEDVASAWREKGGDRQPTLVVGERLASLIKMPPGPTVIAGGEGSMNAPETIEELISAIRQLRAMTDEDAGIVACVREESEVAIHRLLPLPLTKPGREQPLMVNEAPLKVSLEVSQHYLLHLILALLLRSIRVENRMRLVQMENALQHLERGREDLQRQRNHLRQEEIIEEIELTARGKFGIIIDNL